MRSGLRPPTTTSCSSVSFLLGQRLNVAQHSRVNRRYNGTRGHGPIDLRKHVDNVGGPALEPRPPARQRRQSELAVRGPEVAVEVWRMNVLIWTQLVHRRRLRGDIEREQLVFIPGR